MSMCMREITIRTLGVQYRYGGFPNQPQENLTILQGGNFNFFRKKQA